MMKAKIQIPKLMLMRKYKIISFFIIVPLLVMFIFFSGCLFFNSEKENDHEEFNNFMNGKIHYVPDAVTAKKIAEAIWLPIYGKEVLKFKPYIATLKGDTCWVVYGTVKSSLGGAPYIELRKDNCQILIVTHGK